MNAVATVTLVILILSATTLATVIHNEAQGGLAVCRGTTVLTECTTTTDAGFLLWRKHSLAAFFFGDAASVGDIGTVGSTTLTLNSIETVSNAAVVYTSTASEIITEETNITCSDGDVPQSIDIHIKSPSSPLWGYSACSFSQGSVQLSWNAPSVAPECCAQYTVQLSTGLDYNTSETSVTVPIGKESITATIDCIAHDGEMSRSEDMTINNNIAIKHITIEPLNGSCNATTNYQISWTTNTSVQDVCTPPITNSTITCTTSLTNQSSSNTRSMICCVPANETVNVTVTITAGVTTSESVSADVLAQACQMLNSALVSSTPVEPVTDQLSPAGIAAVIMGLGLLILAAVCITLVVYVVWNRIYHRKKHISTYNYLFCMFILSQCCTCQFLQESAQGEGTRGVVYQLTE